MVFLKSIRPAAAAVALITAGLPKDLDIENKTSIQGAAKTIAAGTMQYYPGDKDKYVDLAPPYYWWECGAMFGAMLDYSHYVGDHSYDPVISTALLAQTGPNFDYMLPSHYGQEGNDDQAFWGFAVMTAAERNFPQPNPNIPSWLQMSENIFNSLSSRWNVSACGGGLLWQIFATNPNGLDYRNSVSNGGLFQIAARLARATGNQTYADWATKVWDWTTGIGMIDENYNVFDGASSKENCSKINPQSYSYSHGIYLYGAAVMANVTGDDIWVERTKGLMQGAEWFFNPYSNATDIMYERQCEKSGTCNTDMRSFKGYLSRFMFATARMLPELVGPVYKLLGASAMGASQACTGGQDGTTCGQRWYAGGFDGMVGLGEQMCALEVIQGLLAIQSPPPLKGDQIKTVRTFT
ncbi:glycoside hydrolase [Naviculisporaceae sp. PSN 640]